MFLGFMLMAALFALLLPACRATFDEVYLVKGSQGEPGDGKVIDLSPGSLYMVRIGYKWYPVKEDGSWGKQLTVLNRITMNEAYTNGDIEPLLGTEITGFTNDQIVNVFIYVRGLEDSDTVVPNDTKKRNTIFDLSHPRFMGGGAAGNPTNRVLYFEEGIEDLDTVFIFLTGDVNNISVDQNWTFSTDPRWPQYVLGGSDYSYELRIGARSNSFAVSTSNPFKWWVSDLSGEKGYFCVSGPMFGTLAVFSKRGQGSVGTIGQ